MRAAMIRLLRNMRPGEPIDSLRPPYRCPPPAAGVTVLASSDAIVDLATARRSWFPARPLALRILESTAVPALLWGLWIVPRVTGFAPAYPVAEPLRRPLGSRRRSGAVATGSDLGVRLGLIFAVVRRGFASFSEVQYVR